MLTIGGHGAETLGLLLLALVVDAVLGEMRLLFRVIPHPVVLIGRIVAALDRRLNRIERSERSRLIRGGLVVAALVPAAAAIGAAIHWIAIEIPFGWFAELFVIAALLAQRSLYDHVAAVATALQRSGLVGGRAAVAHVVGRDPRPPAFRPRVRR